MSLAERVDYLAFSRISTTRQRLVADAALVVLVVRLVLAGPAKDLAVHGVLDAVLDRHDDGLVHLVGDDQALTDLAGVPLSGLLAHASPSSLLLSWPGVG